MARRLPDRPPNGIGFGERPKRVPTPLDPNKAHNVLSKPFKVPYKVTKRGQGSNHYNLRRRAATVSYKGMDGVPVDSDLPSQSQTLHKRKDALSSVRLMNDPSRIDNIEKVLKRSFTVPIQGYVQRHSLSLTLGTKNKIIAEPRPLHDPTDEFAIVLYDPSVDGDMITDNQELELQKKKLEDEKEAQDESKEKKSIHPLHAKFMSNGVRNKPLTELLTSSYTHNLTKKFPNVPVVIDPRLSKILRPHQVEGVKFLYRCVTGLAMKDYLDQEKLLSSVNLSSSPPASQSATPEPETIKEPTKSKSTTPDTTESTKKNSYGCIMADEMGLGKTLQCIALMWTLLKQGPQGKSMIDKCIIVCPSSLVNNWANELVKWLGPGTVSSLAIDGKKSSIASMGNDSVAQAINQWGKAKGRNIVKPVLIISYDTLRRNVKELNNCQVGLLLADEGHRLKNPESQTYVALNGINCSRRIILSGTPIQNDLTEYFALLNFANPGLLGTRLQFRKNFEIPILLSRDAMATDKEVEKGKQKLIKLSEIVSKFIIRRTNDILSKYLPCKYEHVIFVNLKPIQLNLYNKLLASKAMRSLIKGNEPLEELDSNKPKGGKAPLRAIGTLKKLCNHPNLLEWENEFEPDEMPDEIMDQGGNRRDINTEWSGKFSILERFLHKINTESDDKIVLISNYTQTLDLIERMCRYKRYGVVRLDGTMNINKRQKLVDRFNDPEGQEFIFLLSSKAGGCGINLIGANRLILMDPDWNPAADQQALARVWRDGQKKDCFIYRFITTGAIEEKIYQRQSMKMSLSSCVVDSKEDVERLFSTDNLRKLFLLNKDTNCETHETFHCKRCSPKGKQRVRSQTMLYGDATSWNHLDHDALQKTNDHLLQNEFQYDDISYAFQYISH
ncbi:DNA repair and recombination protein Rad54p [Monosporozyma unispora]|nr:DNA-dependent ATPase protein rad54 [Kazachstania unispora]